MEASRSSLFWFCSGSVCHDAWLSPQHEPPKATSSRPHVKPVGVCIAHQTYVTWFAKWSAGEACFVAVHEDREKVGVALGVCNKPVVSVWHGRAGSDCGLCTAMQPPRHVHFSCY